MANPGGNPPPTPKNLVFQVTYTCLIPGHNETGVINVFNEFQAGVLVNGKFTPGNGALQPATKNQPIQPQIVAQGGMSKYTISDEMFQITDAGGNIGNTVNGSGPGPGLKIEGSDDNSGIFVSGTPTMAGTYTFTFSATDGMKLNIQQNQYTMQVS